ncbi:MAG TPA: alpha/beta hydrolase [Cyclobacteriaceae bacterium]|nr:alpha/beta hydrolase [Cyclobacteriaceae bacterium]
MWFFIIFAVLLLLASIHVFFQDKFIFQGAYLKQDHTYVFEYDFTEHFIEVEPGIKLNALWFKPDSASRGLILYFHGNAGNLDRWAEVAVDFIPRNYELFIIDYRGYGKSNGTPTELNLYHDAERVYDWVQQRTSAPIIIYGRSLGASIAAYLSSIVQPDLLFLETPFHELRGVLSGLLFNVTRIFPLHYRFSTIDYLAKVKGKVIIFHGTKDFIVPLKSAERLKGVLKSTDEFIVIEGANHDNINIYEIYDEKLTEILD